VTTPHGRARRQRRKHIYSAHVGIRDFYFVNQIDYIRIETEVFPMETDGPQSAWVGSLCSVPCPALAWLLSITSLQWKFVLKKQNMSFVEQELLCL
jgi:hypothetical protein